MAFFEAVKWLSAETEAKWQKNNNHVACGTPLVFLKAAGGMSGGVCILLAVRALCVGQLKAAASMRRYAIKAGSSFPSCAIELPWRAAGRRPSRS